MAEHLEIGREGEKLALDFLKGKKWNILEQNWRSGHREIDIIAESNGELIIIEVKVRKFIGRERLEEVGFRRSGEYVRHFSTRNGTRPVGSFDDCHGAQA